jgi:uncharacterized membrane protein YidH (DUF202 family)
MAMTGVTLVRFALPLGLAVVGLVLALTVSDALGLALIGVGVLVVVANLYIRLSMASQRDRDEEAAHRATFERTGRWPDEG